MNLLKKLFQRPAIKREIDEELRFHLEQRISENVAAGMAPVEAAREARKRFGNVQSVREECRETRGASFGETTLKDILMGLRMLRKNPGFTTVAVLTLALGIGVNTSIFSTVQALVARPLPYANPGRLVQLFQSSPQSPHEPHHSPANFLDYQERGGFEYLAALNDKPFNLAEPGQPAERVRGLQVSADLFPMFGVQPALGRWFTPEEDRPGRNHVVMLDYGFWQRRFSGATNIIGRMIRLDGEAVTVVGVMPAQFHDIMLMGPTYLWKPIAFSDAERTDRGKNYLKCIARIKPGRSLKQAQAATALLAAAQLKDHPDNSAAGLRLVPLAEASLPPEARTIVWSIMALAGFVLLIACANLANLQFARTAARGREFAIRGALGAPRGRLLRQLLVESLLISLIGGVLGLVVAHWSNELLQRQFITDGETVLDLRLNLRILASALAAATASGLAFGLGPAWLASRTDVNEALRQGARGATGDRTQHRMQHSLIVAEVALAMMLLAGAGLVVSGLRSFAESDPGWQVKGLTVGYLTLPESKYGGDDAIRAFTARLKEKLDALPGVDHVAMAWSLPVGQFNQGSSFNIDGRPEPPKGTFQNCCVDGVTPGFFETLGMRLQSGRDFTFDDSINRPAVVIINDAMARAFWPGASPLGQHLDGREIVGVVSNVRFPANPSPQPTRYQTYRPFAQSPGLTFAVAIRGRLSAEALRRTVAEVDPDQPVGNPGLLSSVVNGTLDNFAVGGKILSSFALLGLLLAALGIYGVISGFVVRRIGEIGVRMALGAQIRDVLWLVLKTGLRLSLIGIGIGLVGAYAITRLLASVLSELPASNPLVIALVAMLLVAISLFACWVPARRAAKVDPMVALRHE
jgi:predicted permease